MPDVQRNDEFWENLGITFSVPSEADFDEILDFYLREFVPGSSIHVFFLKKMGLPRPLFVYFCLFNQTLQFLQQMEVKNGILTGAGNRTHDLQNMSLLPKPLDQGSRP